MKLKQIALTGLMTIGLLGSSVGVLANDYDNYQGGTSYNRYGVFDNGPAVRNYSTNGVYLNSRSTNFALYDYKGETSSTSWRGTLIDRKWSPKAKTVDVTATDTSSENGVTVINYDLSGKALSASQTDFGVYDYQGYQTRTDGVVVRFWSAK